MKLLLFALMVLVAGCGSDKSGPRETQEQIAERRFKTPGVCGDAAVAQALSAYKWCAADKATEGVQTIAFDSTKCSVVQTTKVVVMDQAGVTKPGKETIAGEFRIDSSTHRQLHVFLKDFSPMFHEMKITGEGNELSLTGEQFVRCDMPAQPEEVQTEEPVQPGNELGTDI